MGGGVDDFLDFFEIEGVAFEVGAVVDNASASVRAKATFPGRDKGCGVDDFAGGVDLADVAENVVGDGVFGRVHNLVLSF